ncbi:CPBP family intramembrane glutamic endopeptidase [Draconibacterium halophilum]|uniref:CPBP family intramembrane metalloprotease n=1 Tax=Draconibacterium halophilum TaxID=2706887 RepID=A0A6C0RGY2_9BACT|nr:CPBP family intramembrane glutamic endopeptidase [Draconibacterium halophilum]QIA08341.1 CPBP family intramembrane metalloprotease [Draconibacterium halophilum]
MDIFIIFQIPKANLIRSMKPMLHKNQVAIFFLLVFIISWSLIYVIFGSDGIPATKEQQEIIGMTILLGPSIAGLLLLFIYDKLQGLKHLLARLIKLNVNIKWYLVALLTAPLTTFAGLVVFSLFFENVQPNYMTADDFVSILMLGTIGGLFVALFEEIGWTGFAIPRLLRNHGILYTGLIVGIIWGAWHLILFWEDNSFTELVPFLLLIARLFSWLPAYRILMVWLYKNTKSLFLVILMHLALVVSLAVIDPLLYGKELLAYILIRAVILWIIVAIMSLVASKSVR